MRLVKPFPLPLLILLMALLFGLPLVLAQVGSTTSQREAFLTYRCDFDAGTNTAQIAAVLTDANGLAMPRDRYEVTITSTTAVEELPAQRISVAQLPRRQPLRMVLLLDTTDTMPIKEVVNAISTQLAPQLDVNDQVSFIRVDSEITSPTAFFIDKNRLINEFMLDLKPGFGDNSIYNGLGLAVDTLASIGNERKIVLLITDSAPRANSTQLSAAEVATRARNAKVQVYSIGIHLYDDPNDAELIAIATTTQGFTWIYDEEQSSNAATGVAVSDRLDKLIDVLNSEVVISVDMRGQVPDASGQVVLDVGVEVDNGVQLADQIACPVEVLSHSIQFEESVPSEQTTQEPVTVSVQVLSDFTPDITSVVFRVNDEAQQNSDSTTFTFNAPAYLPGTYTLSAQLRDRNDNILATTERLIEVTVQQKLELQVTQGTLADLGTPMQIDAISPPDMELNQVNFTLNAQGNELTFPLGGGALEFVNGRASLVITPNVRGEVERFFPDAKAGDVFEIKAYVEQGNVRQAESEVIRFTYTPLVQLVAPTATAVASTSTDTNTNTTTTVTTTTNTTTTNSFLASLPPPVQDVWYRVTNLSTQIRDSIILSLILLLINLLMIGQVGRTRVQRMIRAVDDSEMSPRLMAITVRRDNIKQTHPLTKRTITLGRGTMNDINLGDDTNISREHAVVMWRRGKWFYTHRKPRVRSRIDGKRYIGYTLFELEPVTEMEMGDAKVFFHSAAQQDVSDFTKTTL